MIFTLQVCRALLLLTSHLAAGSFIQRDKGATWTTVGAFCKRRMDGRLYQDPSDCRAYIYCSGGYAYRAQCDDGLYYDHKLQACNYDNGQCTIDGTDEASYPKTHSKHTLPTETKHPDTRRKGDSGDYESPTEHMIVEKYKQRKEKRIDEAIRVPHTMCVNRLDGTYAHPKDCKAYVLCSRGTAYPSYCPKGLVYSNKRNGCDFDTEGKCSSDNEGRDKSRTAWTHTPSLDRTDSYHTTSPRYSESEYKSETYQNHHNDFNSVSTQGMETMLPEAVESAMTSLMQKLESEAKLASRMSDAIPASARTGRRRPFKMVQKFLHAKPLAKHLSLSGFIITNASYILIQKMNLRKDDVVTMLKTVSSPLSASRHHLRADDVFPKPEPGVCPWPKYSCQYSKYRSIDGSCNNLQHPLWGRSFTPMQRFLPPAYGDMMSSLRRARDGSELPDARRISFTINSDADRPHFLFTTMLMQWGQFVDHDFALTAISKISLDPSGFGQTVDIECGADGCDGSVDNCVPIRVPSNDPVFHNKKCLEFVRSEGVPDLDCSMGPRQQLGQLTSFHDGSMVYGSTAEESLALRDLSTSHRGRLLVTPHPSRKKDLLPTTTEDEDCNAVNSGFCFKGGDERVNEQTALTTMHTIWMREHNRIEEILHRTNPHWNGETLFQETRRIISARIQHITFNEFLPNVLGAKEMSKHELLLQENEYYKGYDSSINPSIANSFSTAAYRFGHTLLVGNFKRLNNQYTELQNLDLSQMFFRPARLMDKGGGEIDGFARGLCAQSIQTFDRHVTEEVTTKLFAENPPNGLGTDLVSLNIQRGRDHGIPGYTAFRKWCGLGQARDFDDLLEIDPATRNRFRRLYKHVDDIDLFPAGVAERSVQGGLVGPTFACIIGSQFRNLRKGDRFWYENAGNQAFTLDQLNEIRKTSLSKVYCENADDITIIQERVMEMPFREAFPSFEVDRNLHGLDVEWFGRLWTSNYNHRVNCSCIHDIDFSKWADNEH